MSCVVTTGPIWLSVQAYTTSWSFVHWFPWFPVPGGEEVNVTLSVHNATYLVATPTVEYAVARAEAAGTPAVLDATGTTSSGVFGATLNTSGRALARLGVAVKLSQGTFDQGDVRVDMTRLTRGTVVGTVAAQLDPSPASRTRYLTFGGLQPSLKVDKVKAALLLEGVSGTVDNRLGLRTYATDREVPGSWNELETDWTSSSADAARNTGELGVSSLLEDTTWYELALLLKPTSDAAYATVKATAFARLS